MVVIGEMKELGEMAMEEHQYLLDFLAEQPMGKVILVGKLFRKFPLIKPYYEVYDRVEELIERLQKEPITRHYILLKGSHSVSLEKAIDYL
jgi:UDP-N-acetylmuramoyl-tripeptide--D-alanyl-D-alanine ligase